jgi:hypothetical protein
LPAATPPAPTGPTGVAASSDVDLAWQSVSGASGYTVYRGTSPGSITTRLTAVGGVAGTTYSDTTAANGTTYYYAVTAVASGVESSPSLTVQSTPRARSCSIGNPVVLENCYPGASNWNVSNTSPMPGGIEGFATATSINKGQSVALKINSAAATTVNIEIYRSGYYGGAGARLFSIIRSVPGVSQPACTNDSNTGLLDCSNWSTSATLTTSASWPSGVYLLRIVRSDNSTDNQILLVVRDDSSHSDLLYGTAMSTFQSYNNYGGKSLYDFNSFNGNTISGGPRAVKVSYDRPFEQPRSGVQDWYTRSEAATVSWLEQQGYDVSYVSNTDLDSSPGQVLNHKAYISPAHDEYFSSGMRNALKQARDSRVNLFFSGSNEVYWRIRFEASPVSGAAGRVQVCYKTVQSGPADPVSSTSTWRDPNGPNQPENALTGEMYVGDNDFAFFPMTVSAAQGTDPVWRYTPLASQPSGTSTTFGSSLVGWEWDARKSNGSEPAGVKTVAASSVNGELVQNNGASYAQNQSATALIVKYTAPSGALVVTTGTNHWNRGLALNAFGVGEPDTSIQQATTNILADMGALPATPSPGIRLDSNAPPAVVSQSPAGGATGVSRQIQPQARFSRAMDPSTITTSSFTLKRPDGTLVSAAVSYDGSTATATLAPSAALDFGTTYTATVSTAAKAADGTPMSSPASWSFTTAAAVPLQVTSTTPADTATSINPAIAPKAVFSRSVDPSTLNSSSFTLTGPAGAVAATIAYDDTTKTATLTPSASLALSTTYTARLSTAVTASDGVPLSSPVTWSFTTWASPPAPPTVTNQSPAAGATGIAATTTVAATFSRAMDPTTITASSFTLTPSGGSAVAASVAYDSGTNTATLTPSAPLTYSTQYTARLAATIAAADGTTLAGPVTWTFTTSAPPPPLSVTSTSPASGATSVARSTTVSATFSRAVDPSTLTTSSFTVTPNGGAAVGATVSYKSASNTATLTPNANLAGGTTFTARIDGTVKAADGSPISAPVSWSFTTAACPCSLFSSTLVPATVNNPTSDGRPGPGPFSYELGVKVTVDQPTQLSAFRFYKSTSETGTHIGRLWSVDGAGAGTLVAQATFAGETASGWQQQAVTGVVLQPGTTYVLSVNANAYFVATQGGLQTQIVSGPVRSVADGLNGVFGSAAGQFPTQSYNSSNYFVDGVFVPSGDPGPFGVTSTTPATGATGVSRTTTVTAQFNRSADSSTITTSSFVLSGPSGSIPATVAYNAGSQTATLTPSSALAYSTTYTAQLTTAIRASDGAPLSSAVQWSFTTVNPVRPQVVRTVPTAGATDAGTGATVSATFSKSLDPTTVNTTTFTLTGPSGAVSGTVAYTDSNLTATFTPNAPLAAGATYTARLDGSIAATDGATLGTPYSWSFSIPATPPPPPTVTSTSPAAGASAVARDTSVTATFSRSLDPTTVTSSSFTLTGPAGAVSATVSYNDATRTATLTPSSQLAGGANFTATVTTAVKANDGTPLANPVSWGFSTAVCPCTLFSNVTQPASQQNPTADGRTGPGPFTLELGVKITVDQSTTLTALRFYKSVGETGTHVGRIWSSTGTLITSVTFANETASGWQQQALASPLTLSTGTTYVVSVNANAYFVTTRSGLQTSVVSGPLRTVADGANGVYALSGGTFPTQTYSSSNYFVDVQGSPSTVSSPTVTSTSPANGATGVSRTAQVTATFSRSMDGTTISGSSFTLTGPSGAVPATVSYSDSTQTATLVPSAALAYGAVYTAQVAATVRASDGASLAAPVQWSFTVVSATPPTVTNTVPASGATNVGGGIVVQATFSKALDPTTVNASTFTLTGTLGAVTGAVAYNASTQTASFTPSSALVPGSYTARLDGSIAATDQTTLGSPYTWTFSVGVTADPLVVSSTTPASGATGVMRDAVVTATFNRDVDPTSVTTSSFQLAAPGGAVLPASVSYDSASKTATLVPSSSLGDTISYTASLSSSVHASDGTALSPTSWSFTTGSCPCSLFASTATPTSIHNATSDGRTGAGPFSYELGVKITVDRQVQLTAIRFYKDSQETGTHVGRVWTSTGAQLASVTFANETASGWQTQALSAPLTLQPATTYVVSVNANAYFVVTPAGLATSIASGPLHSVADNANGVFGSSAGTFPTQSYNNSNYFTDLVVR